MSELERLLRNNPKWISVGLSERDVSEIEREGKSRNATCQARGYKTLAAGNGDDVNIIGFAGEFAVSLALTGNTSGLTRDRPGIRVRDMNCGDLLGFIEVKARARPFKDIAVNAYNLDDNRAYVLCLAWFYPKAIIITGWAWGIEIRAFGEKKKHHSAGHEFYILSSSSQRFKPISSLEQLVQSSKSAQAGQKGQSVGSEQD